MNEEKVKNAVKEILWMARRYADGRRTFSAMSFNDAYDILRDEFGEDIEVHDISKWKDEVLMDRGKYFPYAQDGQFDAVGNRKYLRRIDSTTDSTK